MEFGPRFSMYNLNNVPDANNFNHAVRTLLDSLQNQAASGDSRLKFATGNASATNSQTIYALVQCTPDLSEQLCHDCLHNATELLPNCCNGRQGGRVITPSCNIRYEINRFYDVTADAPTPSTSPSPSASPSPAISPPPSVSPSPPTSGSSPPSATSPSPPPPPTAQPPASQAESPPPPPNNSASQNVIMRTPMLVALQNYVIFCLFMISI